MAIARRSPHRNGTEGGGPPPTRKPIGRWTWLGAALGLALLAFAAVLLLGEGLADRTPSFSSARDWLTGPRTAPGREGTIRDT